MAWIRLDDQIAHHPKFLKAGLSSWLWVCCLGFAQKFLTDGHIPYEAVASLAGCIERPQNHIDKLVKIGLLDKVSGGYQVHDYLEFNEKSEVVKKRREYDRVRKMSERTGSGQRPDISGNPLAVLARAPASHPIPSHPKKKEQKISTVASPPHAHNGYAQTFKVIVKLAHQVLSTKESRPDQQEALKILCAKNHLDYDSGVIYKALNSAEVQQKKRKDS